MSDISSTTRRSFLKAGALVAAPVAAVGIPAAALAQDPGKAALARLQDERAIEALAREFVRTFNRGGARVLAGGQAPAIAASVSKLSLDLAEEPQRLHIADDGASASARFACTADMAQDLAGSETIVQMARLQGGAAAVHSARKTLVAHYARQGDAWQITGIALA